MLAFHVFRRSSHEAYASTPLKAGAFDAINEDAGHVAAQGRVFPWQRIELFLYFMIIL